MPRLLVFFFVRAHASALLVATNQSRKVNEVPPQTEVLAKLRFNKHKDFGDQPSSQNFRAAVNSNSWRFMSHGVNTRRDFSISSKGMSLLVFGLFAFKLNTFRRQREAESSKLAESWVRCKAHG